MTKFDTNILNVHTGILLRTEEMQQDDRFDEAILQEAELFQDAVYRLALTTDHTRSLEELFQTVHAIIGEVMVAKNFYIALYDEKEQSLRFPYFVDEADPSPMVGAFKPGKGLTEYVLQTGESLYCDLAKHAELEAQGKVILVGPPSPIWLGVPLVVDGKIIGVMVVQHYTNPLAYGLRELRMLEFFSTLVALAISRKHAERALKQSEERYRSLFNHAPIGIGVADLSGNIFAANPAMLQATGMTLEELRVQKFSALYLHLQDWQKFDAILNEKDRVEDFEAQLRRKDGSMFYALINADLLKFGQREMIFVTLRDITERVRSDEVLRESEAKYRGLFDHMLNGFALQEVVTDDRGEPVDYIFLEVNHAFEDLVGLKSVEVVGKRMSQVLPGIEKDPNIELFSRVARSGKSVRFEQYITPLRKYFDIAVFSSRKGQIATIFTDITERKEAEEHARQDTLRAQTLAEVADLLTEARLKLEPTMSSVAQLTAEKTGDACLIGFVSNDRKLLEPVAFHHADPHAVPLLRKFIEAGPQPIGESFASQVIHSGEPVLLTDNTHPIIRDGLPPTFHPYIDLYGIHSILLVPIRVHSLVIGILGIARDRPGNRYTPEDQGWLQNIADRLGMAITNRHLYEELQRRLGQLQALREIDITITGSVDLRINLRTILEQVVTQMKVDAASILLMNPYTHILEYAAGRGFQTAALQHTRLRLGEGYAGQAALDQRIIHISNLQDRRTDFLRSPHFYTEGFLMYYAVPLIARTQVKGVLEIFHRSPLEPTEEWMEFMEALAGQAAIAIDNASLFNNLRLTNQNLLMAYDATIEGWSRALDLRDKETEGHSQRVTEITLRLAQAMGINEEEQVHIRRGALLHDIGKMGIPDAILLKPGPLTDEEWVIMRKHPVYAYELLSPIAHLKLALDIPYCHHEKWDGSGYPRGLIKEQIPMAARIFSIVDIWDALSSDRPYRAAWPEAKVNEYLRSQAGIHFDPRVVDVFFEQYESWWVSHSR